MTQHDTELVSAARTTTRGEVPFDGHEMLCSRTDERGVITAGNTVFQRLAGYDWDELLGAPHKIVRHPGMPRGAFFFKWQQLKAGRAVALYVKNRAKDGRHYWVLAVAWPIEGGYQSIRLKPTTDIFEKIKPIYERILADETSAKLSPEASGERLIREIKALGYSSYEEFQSNALAEEMAARAKFMGEEVPPAQMRFGHMRDAILSVRDETQQMTESFKAIRTVPMNMRILASRLENAGGPISAISVNYGSMLDEMANWVREFVNGNDSAFVQMRDAIMNGMYLTCVARIMTDMSDHYRSETADRIEGIDPAREYGLLDGHAEEYRKRAVLALKVVEKEAGRLSRSVLDMKRYVTGLSSTRMMCKIESASLSGTDNSLAGIVEQLDACQNEIEARLARIVEYNTAIQSNTSMLRAIT